MDRTKHCLWFATVALTLICAGCESDNGDKDKVRDKDLERIARRERRQQDRDLERRPDSVVARDRRDRLDDRARDRTSDRASDRISDRASDSRQGLREIPTEAQAVDTGEGSRLEYEPRRDGVIYVYDADDDRVIYVGRVRDRERFRLDPDGGRALINSRPVFRSDLNPRHRYRLYFDPAS